MARTIVPIGPYHPLQEEPEFFTLTVEGERVTGIDVSVGYNHRGIDVYNDPFSWYMMDRDMVRIVAAAPGVIISKSDGNFFAMGDVLEQFPPEVVRFFLLNAHFRSQLDYSADRLADSFDWVAR